jgi:putative CocE/NonD family hydrolase
MSSGPRPPRRPSDLLTAAMTRQLKLGEKRNKITVARGLRVPMRDGTILLADHYAPVGAPPRPTVLMRSPYGRGWQFAMMARPYAERGYHVVLQSTRGTFGSGGRFTPAADEAADGQDTVGWLRTQDWFDGRLATVGASYLAFAAWALALDPPPELFAMALHISPHDLAAAGFGQGPFELYNLLMWSDLMAHQELHGSATMMWRTMTTERRLATALNRLPLAQTAATIGGNGAPWYSDWIANPEPGDPYWAGYSAAAALDRVAVPTLLVSGFHDFFVEQTLRQYHALNARGVPVGLTVGPWNHMTLDMGLAIRETLDWLDAFADPARPGVSPRPAPVRVWRSGTETWRDLAEWPPADAERQDWYLRADAGLDTATPAPESPGSTSFRYDPADPTPSVGGRIMSIRTGGSRDNSAVEARPDVLTFSSAPLTEPVEVAGVPRVRLYLGSDNVYHDLFVRLCDVDPQGVSRNLTDQIVRPAPQDVPPGQVREVTITMTDVAHVFLAGHRIRLQVSGGAHPRFARNLGLPLDLLQGVKTVPVTHHVRHDSEYPSALNLPVVGAARPHADAASRPRSVAGELPG